MKPGIINRRAVGRLSRQRAKSFDRISLLCIALAATLACGRARQTVPPLPAAGPSQTDFVFEAVPQVVAPGQASLLRWKIQGAAKVTIEEASGTGTLRTIGEFDGTGTLEVRPARDSTYVVSCKGSTTFSCASVSIRVRVGSP